MGNGARDLPPESRRVKGLASPYRQFLVPTPLFLEEPRAQCFLLCTFLLTNHDGTKGRSCPRQVPLIGAGVSEQRGAGWSSG